MTAHRLHIRVYYEDTDFSGLVYHASYLRFRERGRTELLRELGLGQRELVERGSPFFVVRAMDVDFRRPARMDDLVAVETAVVEVGGATVRMEQRVLREQELLVSAKVTVAAVESGRARRLPEDVRDKFQRVRRAKS